MLAAGFHFSQGKYYADAVAVGAYAPKGKTKEGGIIKKLPISA
jgi:hypothetical protein